MNRKMNKMKNIPIAIIAILACMFISACNDEWKDELYDKSVSFVNSGVTNVYLRYSEGGVVSYKIPIIISGSTKSNRDVQVTVAIDPDTIAGLNFEQFRYREDLYFKQLEEKHYNFPSMITTIPKGEDVGILEMQFKLADLNLVDKYILPLKIAETSEYEINPRKWYRKSLMRIVPFNDYSGEYQSANMSILYQSEAAQSTEIREARVVDENSVFFYAGMIDHEARDRESYKVIAEFDKTDGTVTLSALNPAINFSQTEGWFEVLKNMDPIQPYLEVSNTVLHLKYQYDDLTYPGYPLTYRVEGTMTLERRRNIQIPEEDQQIIF
jgi:hypothetical protein